MAITDPSDTVQAQTTNYYRQLEARAPIGDVVFQAVGFSVGRGGYNPADPVHIVPVDPTATALMDQVYPAPTGFASFQEIDTPGDASVVVYNCRLPATPVASNADYGLGEIGIWGQVLQSKSNPLEVGTYFLIAIGHMPIRAKTNRDVILFRVVVNY